MLVLVEEGVQHCKKLPLDALRVGFCWKPSTRDIDEGPADIFKISSEGCCDRPLCERDLSPKLNLLRRSKQDWFHFIRSEGKGL